VQRVVVVLTLKAGQKNLSLVDVRIELKIAIHVSVDEQMGWLGDNDLVVDHRDSKGGTRSSS